MKTKMTKKTPTKAKATGSSVCSVCGKPLTDPISVETGIGPICRVERKNKELENKTGNMFANRAEYSYEVFQDLKVIAIEDLGGYKSVTNDIENILQEIQHSENLRAQDYKIMYKDSMGIWDGISFRQNQVSFFSINERAFINAFNKLIQ